MTSTNTLQVPDTLAATLQPDVLQRLVDVLAPAPDRRATVDLEIEIEAVGEGTFTLTYKGRALSSKKGFAKAPQLCVRVDKGGWPLLRDELQAAVDGFPSAPRLRKLLEIARTLPVSELDAVLRAVLAVKDACLHVDVAGESRYALARGPIDEATRELKIAVNGAALRGLLRGSDVESLQPRMQGDRTVGTSLMTAFAPLLSKLPR